MKSFCFFVKLMLINSPFIPQTKDLWVLGDLTININQFDKGILIGECDL